MLDVSIPQVTAKFKTPEALLEFMKKPLKIEAKTDGVKLTIIKINDTGTLDDWIVSYKGQIFYRGEFAYASLEDKNTTIGNSQFDKVFDHLESLNASDYSSIPDNTELFCEFLVSKNTVMSEYTKTGAMILLGHGKAKPTLRFGKVNTGSEVFETQHNQQFAKALKIITPPVLFDGSLFPTKALINGTQNKELQKAFASREMTLRTLETDIPEYFNTLVKAFLDIESEFGGKEEGIVFHQGGNLYKAQQEFQLDKEARRAKKLRFMEDNPDDENAYWKDVLEVAKKIAEETKTQNIQQGLGEIASKIQKLNFSKAHSKKNEATVKDDIQTNARMFYLKGLEGNNGGLVIGKFRILTNGHVKMIDKAIKECDEVVIGCVTGSKTEKSRELRLKALRETFPNLKVVELVSGNIFTALKKADININTLYAGSDRIEEYERQLLKAPGIQVSEIERTGADISATKVQERLRDYAFFKNNTPKQVHRFYDEYKEAFLES